MKKALLLVTWAGTIHLAKELLENSFQGFEYPIVVAVNEVEAVTDQETLTWLFSNYETIPIQGNRWEIGGLQAIFSCTGYEEWVLIQDTLEVKDRSIFNWMLSKEFEGKSLSFGPGWLCYLGKYRRAILEQFILPLALTKLDAFYYEHMVPKIYGEIAQVFEGIKVDVLFPDWGNNNPKNYEDDKWGRKNLVLYNPYVVKRKSLEWDGPAGIKTVISHL